jgi:hypothetical protein
MRLVDLLAVTIEALTDDLTAMYQHRGNLEFHRALLSQSLQLLQQVCFETAHCVLIILKTK